MRFSSGTATYPIHSLNYLHPQQLIPPRRLSSTLAVGLCCLLAVLAPLIYALRSGDLFTVVVSIVALVACFTILTFSRTIIDMMLAAIVYFTSAFISVVMFAADRIVKEIRSATGSDGPVVVEPQVDRETRI